MTSNDSTDIVALGHKSTRKISQILRALNDFANDTELGMFGQPAPGDNPDGLHLEANGAGLVVLTVFKKVVGVLEHGDGGEWVFRPTQTHPAKAALADLMKSLSAVVANNNIAVTTP